MDLPVHLAKSCQSLPGYVNVNVDTASKQGHQSLRPWNCTSYTAVAAVPDADACVIDSLHLTFAMSQQRSIQ